MFEGLSYEEMNQYSQFASGALFQAGMSRYVCSIGKRVFRNDTYNPMLFRTYDRFFADYEEVGVRLWEYTALNDVDLSFPHYLYDVIDWSKPFGYDEFTQLFEQAFFFDTTPAAFINASMKAFENTFQGVIRFAGIALSVNERSFIKDLFGKNGLLRITAFNKMLMQTRAISIEYPNGLILKPSNIKPETGYMPLAHSNVENPNFQYGSRMFILQSMPNDDGSLKPGTRVSVGSTSGVLIRPDSAECEQMVSDIIDAWLEGLVLDNNVKSLLW